MRLRMLQRLTVLATVACGYAAAQPSRSEGNQTRIYPCYGATSDWKAWIEASPDDGRLELVVSGTVTTPTGNNRRLLLLGPTTRSDPPHQFLDLQIKGIGNIATTIVHTEEVQGRFPALPRYGAVIITCNGHEVGRIETVEIKR